MIISVRVFLLRSLGSLAAHRCNQGGYHEAAVRKQEMVRRTVAVAAGPRFFKIDAAHLSATAAAAVTDSWAHMVTAAASCH